MGKESYHVYLSHLLCFNLAQFVINNLLVFNKGSNCVLWAILSLVGIVVLCNMMDIVEKWIRNMVGKKSSAK